jgi:hypothetical protein
MSDDEAPKPPFQMAAAHLLQTGRMPIKRLPAILNRKKGLLLVDLASKCEAREEPTYQRNSSNNQFITLEACRAILITGTCNPNMPWLQRGLGPLIENEDDLQLNAFALKSLVAGCRTKPKQARNKFKPMCNQYQTPQSQSQGNQHTSNEATNKLIKQPSNQRNQPIHGNVKQLYGT